MVNLLSKILTEPHRKFSTRTLVKEEPTKTEDGKIIQLMEKQKERALIAVIDEEFHRVDRI